METPCIVWKRACTQRGYGVKWTNGKAVYVHRLTWESEHGAIPDGMCVLHSCDNPPCFNVDHLFLGTHAENMADMKRKGRNINQAFSQAKLTPEQVKSIREQIDSGVMLTKIATKYGVHKNTIGDIKWGRNWKRTSVSGRRSWTGNEVAAS